MATRHREGLELLLLTKKTDALNSLKITAMAVGDMEMTCELSMAKYCINTFLKMYKLINKNAPYKLFSLEQNTRAKRNQSYRPNRKPLPIYVATLTLGQDTTRTVHLHHLRMQPLNAKFTEQCLYPSPLLAKPVHLRTKVAVGHLVRIILG